MKPIKDKYGAKLWFKGSKLHRTNGPAVVRKYGYKEWWFEGRRMNVNSTKEFTRILSMKSFWADTFPQWF